MTSPVPTIQSTGGSRSCFIMYSLPFTFFQIKTALDVVDTVVRGFYACLRFYDALIHVLPLFLVLFDIVPHFLYEPLQTENSLVERCEYHSGKCCSSKAHNRDTRHSYGEVFHTNHLSFIFEL